MKGRYEMQGSKEERSCDELVTVMEFTYLGNRVNAGEGCEAAVTARTRCAWAKYRECGELLCKKIFQS